MDTMDGMDYRGWGSLFLLSGVLWRCEFHVII